MTRERLTVTVPAELASAGRAAVADGAADSVSSWVSEAIAEKVARDRRLQLLARVIEDFEAEHGRIDEAEIVAQQRGDRSGATVVRPQRRAGDGPGTEHGGPTA